MTNYPLFVWRKFSSNAFFINLDIGINISQPNIPLGYMVIILEASVPSDDLRNSQVSIK